MALETTFWGIIHMNSIHAEKVKSYLLSESYNNKMIDKYSIFSESSRGISLAFGKVVRGGYEERDFWFNEIESFLKEIEAFYCTICFEFEDKEGTFVYDYLYTDLPKGWTVYENHFNRQNSEGKYIAGLIAE